MNFVYEKNYIIIFLQFIHYGFHSFLKLTTIFSSGDKASKVK